jgi:hypothetical protein
MRMIYLADDPDPEHAPSSPRPGHADLPTAEEAPGQGGKPNLP